MKITSATFFPCECICDLSNPQGILAAPLIMGNDLRKMSPGSIQILQNRMAVQINQDPNGKAGTRISEFGAQELWARDLVSNGVSGSPRFAVALLNKGDVPVDMTVDFKLLSSLLQAARVFDVWAQTLLGTFNTQYEYPLRLPFTCNVTLLSCTPQKPFHLMVKSPAAGRKSKRVCSFELTQQSQAALTSYWRPFTRRQYVTNLTPVQVNCVPVSILRFRRFGRVAQTTPPASRGPQPPAIDASAARNVLRDFCSTACRVLPAPSARCGSPACVRASVPSEMACVPIALAVTN